MGAFGAEMTTTSTTRPAPAHQARAPEQFARLGYGVLERWLAPGEVDEARRAVAAVGDRDAGGCARPNNTLVPLRWDDAAVGLVLSGTARVARLARAVGGFESTDVVYGLT